MEKIPVKESFIEYNNNKNSLCPKKYSANI